MAWNSCTAKKPSGPSHVEFNRAAGIQGQIADPNRVEFESGRSHGLSSPGPQHESCRKISHKLRPSDMETVSEVVYWAVLLYTPIYWFIGLIVLGGCFIAGTIWSTLACSFRLQTRWMSRRSHLEVVDRLIPQTPHWKAAEAWHSRDSFLRSGMFNHHTWPSGGGLARWPAPGMSGDVESRSSKRVGNPSSTVNG